jgi:hypothetical protein
VLEPDPTRISCFWINCIAVAVQLSKFDFHGQRSNLTKSTIFNFGFPGWQKRIRLYQTRNGQTACLVLVQVAGSSSAPAMQECTSDRPIKVIADFGDRESF